MDAQRLNTSRSTAAVCRFTLGDSFCLYGDPAYPLRIRLQAPLKARALTPLMMGFNKSMSTVRVSVEWLFNDIATYF